MDSDRTRGTFEGHFLLNVGCVSFIIMHIAPKLSIINIKPCIQFYCPGQLVHGVLPLLLSSMGVFEDMSWIKDKGIFKTICSVGV